jgi:superfamily II DNA or RNA helicase
VGGAVFEGRKVLVLTKRIEHYEKFKEFFPPSNAFRYISSDNKNKNELLTKLKKGSEEFSAIFGTTSMLSVGVDIPMVDTLVIACDMSGKVLTTQSVGRALRSFRNKKQPIIIDFHDGWKWDYDMKQKGLPPIEFNSTFNRQFKSRLEYYLYKGYEINYKGGMVPYAWMNKKEACD